MTQSIYIYGLVRTGDALACDLGEGIAAGPVRLLPAAHLFALAGAVPHGPVPQTRRNMIAHTSVLERAMARTDVLPLRFGTVASDIGTLASCVESNAERFAQAFQAISGRVELGLKASWRDGVIFAEIIASDAELCRLRDRLRSRPASEAYYERVELGRRVEAALAERRAAETAAIMAELSPLAEREADLRALDEDMIFNRAFLVHRDREADFDARVQSIGESRGSRMSFRYVGPVPPYNFVDLRVNWLAEVV